MSELSCLRPHGFFEVSTPEGKTLRGETLQCVHCGNHWQMVKGSGKVRGFCMRCNGPTCGPQCSAECVPQEKMLEIMEGTRNPTAVSVAGIWVP